MRLTTLTLLLCLFAPALACNSQDGARSANAPKPAVAAVDTPGTAAAQIPLSKTCALLTGEELKEVQGEATAEAQGSEHAAGALSMSQCFFRLPTFARSVSLEVVRAAPGADASALKEYWRRRFHPEAVEARERARELKEEREREREKELERERAAGQVREGGHGEEEEKEGEDDVRPQRVNGLGDEAYLTGGGRTSTLSVKKGDAVLRLSVSGPEERPAKLKKLNALAAKALKRL